MSASVAPRILVGPPTLDLDEERPHAPFRPLPFPRMRESRGSRSRAHALLPTTPGIFPWLERRFAPGEATLWIGAPSFVGVLLELLYAGSARAGGTISLIEGANRLNPYRVAEAGRTLDIDSTVVMRRIRLARAFTAYQLVALVDGWASEVRRSRPTLLVAHDLPALFETDEVPKEERAPLLRHVAGTLRALSERARVPMLLTLPGEPSLFPGLTDRGPRLYDVVRFRPRSGTLHLEAYRESIGLSLVRRPDGQRGLEEFGPDPLEEVIRWDVPHPRTGRPWRNG